MADHRQYSHHLFRRVIDNNVAQRAAVPAAAKIAESFNQFLRMPIDDELAPGSVRIDTLSAPSPLGD
jgi:hypothetical protein